MASDSGLEPNRSSVPPGLPGALTVVGSHSLSNVSEGATLAGGTELGLLSTLRRRYRLVLGIGATTFALVMAVTLLSPMEFAASSRLYLGELDGKARSSLASAEDLELALGGQSDLASEIEILRSRSLVSRAVREAGLNVELRRFGAAPVRYWRWRLSGRDPNLLDAADKEVRGVRARLIDDSQRERRYEVRFTSPAEYELWSPEVRSLRAKLPGQLLARGELGRPLSLPGLELTLLPGTERSPEPGTRYQVLVQRLEDSVDSALKTLEVSAPKSSGRGDPVKVVTLTFRQASPTLAAEFLEQLMRSYLQERQAWKTADASAVEAFVTEQLQSTRLLLDDIQRKLADYRTKNRAVVLDNEAKAMIAQISKYEEQRVAARLELAALTDVDQSLSLPNLPVEAYMLGEAKDSVLEELAGSLSKARRDLTDLEVRYNVSAPAVREQRAQVNAQLATIRSYVRARVRRAEENLRTLDRVIQQYEDKLRTVPEAELGLAQLTRESQVYGALYSNLLMRQQQTAIVKASTVSRNRVLDPARVGYREESPELPLRLMSGVLGLLFGAGLVVAGRLISNSFGSEAEVQTALSPLPVLASVPKRRQRWARGRRKGSATRFDLLAGDVNFEFVEAFRALRTRLYQTALANGGGEVLLVTSPSPGDGKTTVVLSLASILAADGRSVLVVDADLRRERRAGDSRREAKPPREADLRAALIGQCGFRDAVERITVAGGEYDFLGPDGVAPVELLAGARMTEFLAEARSQWDFVLLDVPCFPLVSDALALAPSVDAVLTVIRLDATPVRLAQEHVRRLSAVAPGQALVVNDPGSHRAREVYPVAPQRAFSRALGRWTWRDWDSMDPPANGGGRRRGLLPLSGAIVLVGAALASHAMTREPGAPAEGEVQSGVQALEPAALAAGAPRALAVSAPAVASGSESPAVAGQEREHELAAVEPARAAIEAAQQPRWRPAAAVSARQENPAAPPPAASRIARAATPSQPSEMRGPAGPAAEPPAVLAPATPAAAPAARAVTPAAPAAAPSPAASPASLAPPAAVPSPSPVIPALAPASPTPAAPASTAPAPPSAGSTTPG